jgi:hypothetical protein
MERFSSEEYCIVYYATLFVWQRVLV